MDYLIHELEHRMFKEDRPRYLLHIALQSQLEKTLESVDCGQYVAHFVQLDDTTFYTCCTGHVQRIGNCLQKLLGHQKFFLTEIAYIPSLHALQL